MTQLKLNDGIQDLDHIIVPGYYSNGYPWQTGYARQVSGVSIAQHGVDVLLAHRMYSPEGARMRDAIRHAEIVGDPVPSDAYDTLSEMANKVEQRTRWFYDPVGGSHYPSRASVETYLPEGRQVVMSGPPPDRGQSVKAFTDLYIVWDQFAELTPSRTQQLAARFLHFHSGEPIESVHKWFEDQHVSFRVADVQAGIRLKNGDVSTTHRSDHAATAGANPSIHAQMGPSMTEHTTVAEYNKFKADNESKISLLAAEFDELEDESHWELVESMKARMGSKRANETSGDDAEICNALNDSDEWVASNCSSGGIKEDVAMALWLYGPDKGRALLEEARLTVGQMSHATVEQPQG